MLIFSYGTLSEPIIRDRVLGHEVETRPATLRGYRKVCGWDYFTIVPAEGSVEGVVFEADAEDILRMDAWEDVPVYRMFSLEVETPDGIEEAGCYVMPEPPESYEFVDDDRIAAIPLEEIIHDVELMVGGGNRLRASVPNVKVQPRELTSHG